MKIDVMIDKLTPCLEEVATGEIFQTTFAVAKTEELAELQDAGWNFDWEEEGEKPYQNVYKLTLKDDDVIQGLVATEVKKGAVYIALAESAPHNLGNDKKLEGVGGHLIAIGIKLSVAMGFNGYVYFEAKNEELANHYTEKFGAQLLGTRLHDWRMEIDEIRAMDLLGNYTLEGDLNVEGAKN